MNFKELFAEALRIVKKTKGDIDKRDMHIGKVHQKEINHAKKEMEPLLVGYIGDIKIIKSKHATEIRDDESFARDFNISNDTLLSVFRKLFLKATFKPRQKTAVIYKNDKHKYDMMVVDLRGKVLTIITVIKKNKRTPYDAKASTIHKDQINIIVEGKKLQIDNWITI